ncbi:glycosyltransferase [Latilactobacillus curvatus]|uniref:glycosyltransferase n=1 Tax=Latilactobacillus curvatus TaxID=28038 RepID=UPI0012FDC225|nr:glycosyltransferase [Latilactobacillus curvatus]MCT2881152.1 glycosyltransferase [Latilactobacillus curvatus]
MIKQWTNLIVSTKYQRDQILDRFGHLSQKIHAIPVGVIEDDVLTLPKVAMRDRQPHSLVTVSRLDRQKSVDLQVAAVAQLVEEFPDIQLHGWVYDKQAALNDKQIFLETSNSEAFGISMMEAQSYGLPLITTPVESATELIDDGVSGMIVSDIIEGREKLVKMMADDIRRLFKDDDQLQAMSDAAYLHRMNFSSEAVWHNWQLWVADVEV